MLQEEFTDSLKFVQAYFETQSFFCKCLHILEKTVFTAEWNYFPYVLIPLSLLCFEFSHLCSATSIWKRCVICWFICLYFKPYTQGYVFMLSLCLVDQLLSFFSLSRLHLKPGVFFLSTLAASVFHPFPPRLFLCPFLVNSLQTT